MLTSGPPLDRTRLVPADQAATGDYDGDELDLMQAAARVALGDAQFISGIVLAASTEMPVSAGVSSSAALTLSAVAALLTLRDGVQPDTGTVCELARRAETHERHTGAGWMDFLACGYGGVSQIHAGQPPTIAAIAPSLAVPVVLIDTRQRRTTTAVLASKRQRFLAHEPDMSAYVEQAPLIVAELDAALRKRRVDFAAVGTLINEGQSLLRDRVHCSTPLIDECARRAVAAGAYGAKLSGSGHGGVLFALVPPDAVSSVLAAVGDMPVHAIALPHCDPNGVTCSMSAPLFVSDGAVST